MNAKRGSVEQRARHARKAPQQDVSGASNVPATPSASNAADAPNAQPEPARTQPAPASDVAAVGSSAALISVCVLISRITGLLRTWAMAFALGATLLSSSYQVANTLPNMLYEMVVGGMLVTAFLPVYVSVKKRLGNDAGNDYASNLFTIVILFLGIVSALCMLFPEAVIYTQSFLSDQGDMAQSTFFFQFFAVQVVFYGISAILSGLLNANRDYFWSSIAPVANNIIVIGTFVTYAIVAPHNPETALYIIAIGNPAGVIVQALMQWPALKRNGIRIRPHINWHDPALRETVSIGVPAIFVMLISFVVVSVQNAASYSFSESGPSIIAYSRLWFTLPYAFLAVPITTAMFTELADMQTEGDIAGLKRGIISGTNQILFFMIPFALYLMVFSTPLVTMYHMGAFSMESVLEIARYLAVFAIGLPFYAIYTYAQKIFSSLRIMKLFAVFTAAGGAAQIALTLLAAARPDIFPIETIGVAEGLFYLVAELLAFAHLNKRLGGLPLRSTARTIGVSLLLGGTGAAAGAGVLWLLESFVGPLSGSIPQAFLYTVAGGLMSLAVTFGPAIKLRLPEAAFLLNIVQKVQGRLHRA